MDGQTPTRLPEELRIVPRDVLEEYVSGRIHEFSVVLADELGTHVARETVEAAFQRAGSRLAALNPAVAEESVFLRFEHTCRWHGCSSKECALCINNPNKACEEHFDECYADNQVLRSRCSADVHVQMISGATGHPVDMCGIEVQLCIVDGEAPLGARVAELRQLLRSDDGKPLLASHFTSTRGDGLGRLLLPLLSGCARLPDLYVSDKNDTFHCGGASFASFRLLAVVVTRDLNGNVLPLEGAPHVLSSRFVVKTQRALNDYRKSEYPHFRDKLTKLKFIGNVTAQRLHSFQAHVQGTPFASIDRVDELRQLMMYADQNREVENKLRDLLNMKGKHAHKWDYLRSVLTERVVYDDTHPRAWFADEAKTKGLVFGTKQGQVNMDKPFGLAQLATREDGSRYVQVVSGQDSASMEAVRVLRVQAAEAWKRPGHPGWSLVREPLELMGNASGGASRMGSDALEQMAVQMFIKAEAAGGGYGASTAGSPAKRGGAARGSAPADLLQGSRGWRASTSVAPAVGLRHDGFGAPPTFTFGSVGVGTTVPRQRSRTSSQETGGVLPTGSVVPSFGGGMAAAIGRARQHSGSGCVSPSSSQPDVARRHMSAPIGFNLDADGASAAMLDELAMLMEYDTDDLGSVAAMQELLQAGGAMPSMREAADVDAYPQRGASAPNLLDGGGMASAGMPSLRHGVGTALIDALDMPAAAADARQVSTGLPMPQLPVVSSGNVLPFLDRVLDGSTDGGTQKRGRAAPASAPCNVQPGCGAWPAAAAAATAAPGTHAGSADSGSGAQGEHARSSVLLYHSESSHRHVPRLRLDDDGGGSGSGDQALYELLTGLTADAPGAQGQQQGTGDTDRVLPTGLLSNNLHQVRLESDRSSAPEQRGGSVSDSEVAARVAAALAPLPAGTAAHRPMSPVPMCPDSNSDSFNKTLSILLHGSGSDSFRHMLEPLSSEGTGSELNGRQVGDVGGYSRRSQPGGSGDLGSMGALLRSGRRRGAGHNRAGSDGEFRAFLRANLVPSPDAEET